MGLGPVGHGKQIDIHMPKYKGGDISLPSPGAASFNHDLRTQTTINPAQLHDTLLTSAGQMEVEPSTLDAYNTHLPGDPEHEALKKAYERHTKEPAPKM